MGKTVPCHTRADGKTTRHVPLTPRRASCRVVPFLKKLLARAGDCTMGGRPCWCPFAACQTGGARRHAAFLKRGVWWQSLQGQHREDRSRPQTDTNKETHDLSRERQEREYVDLNHTLASWARLGGTVRHARPPPTSHISGWLI